MLLNLDTNESIYKQKHTSTTKREINCDPASLVKDENLILFLKLATS